MVVLEGMPHLTRTLAIYLNVAYYCLLSPIKITYNKNSGIVTGMKCQGVHKMLNIFMSTVPEVVLAYYTFCSDFIGTEEGQKVTTRIDKAIAVMTSCCWFCLVTVIKLELWLAPSKITEMFNKLMAVELQLRIPRNRLWRFKVPTVLVAFVHGITTVTSIIVNYMDLVTAVYESWSVKMFLVFTSSPWESQLLQFGTKFLIILSGVFLMFAYALKEHVKTSSDYNEISNLLKLMLEASLSTRKCFGLTFVASCFTLLPYFANRLKNLFGNSLYLQYVYFHYMMSLVGLLFLSAEANSKLHSSLPPYALKNSKRHSQLTTSNGRSGSGQSESHRRRKLLLLDVISREGLGLGGRCMTLNYTFFSSIMASILAYSISIMQFQSGGSNAEFRSANTSYWCYVDHRIVKQFPSEIWCEAHRN